MNTKYDNLSRCIGLSSDPLLEKWNPKAYDLIILTQICVILSFSRQIFIDEPSKAHHWWTAQPSRTSYQYSSPSSRKQAQRAFLGSRKWEVGSDERSSKSWAQPINSSLLVVHHGRLEGERQGECRGWSAIVLLVFHFFPESPSK